MHPSLHILADDSNLAFELLIFVAAMVVWGIKSLSKLAKNGPDAEKQRLRMVRRQMEHAQAAARLAAQQGQHAPMQRQNFQRPAVQRGPMQRAPVQLAPQIAQRIPPPVTPRAPKQRPPKRAAANYNAMAQSKRPVAAPPPLPTASTQQSAPPLRQVMATGDAVAPVSVRRAATVNAQAINRWLNPITLKQQFILTEVFQPPMSLRDPPG